MRDISGKHDARVRNYNWLLQNSKLHSLAVGYFGICRAGGKRKAGDLAGQSKGGLDYESKVALFDGIGNIKTESSRAEKWPAYIHRRRLIWHRWSFKW